MLFGLMTFRKSFCDQLGMHLNQMGCNEFPMVAVAKKPVPLSSPLWLNMNSFTFAA